MKNIFITGDIRIGKSTVIKKVLDLLRDNYENNLNIGGYKCCRNIIIEKNLTKYEFFLVSLRDLSSYKIIENKVINNKDNVEIFTENFNLYSQKLNDDFKNCHLIILDEIGCAESNSYEFIDSLNKVLDSNKAVLGVLKKKNCFLINDIKKEMICFCLK
ncbi:nucleoside-triphosphatase [Terrisporobacter hibernicus]|uniref:Nucleoside-triphosphatase n=1 Tax=Terrisporobacter hibernicus TaxID=2813371 RepID=A0AAX2ZEL8_9FIRM|nr:nucleoside-triphosphatase [Terrisporobacter hibernicus]UEL47774.1 nucleoside-triphosphatase [Terrisporobacter hibernicus]